jgi:hypothetical protein
MGRTPTDAVHRLDDAGKNGDCKRDKGHDTGRIVMALAAGEDKQRRIDAVPHGCKPYSRRHSEMSDGGGRGNDVSGRLQLRLRLVLRLLRRLRLCRTV